MPSIELQLAHTRYQIQIGAGALGALGHRMRALTGGRRAAVIGDEAIADRHAARALRSLEAAGIEVEWIPLPGGEASKDLATVQRLYEPLVSAGLDRKSPVIAVGGGTVGDTAGYVAATYLRGVPFIACPTTLLAMVDASVGGKVGVNLPEGKNLVGAFHQPSHVVADPDALATLPARELRCGLAECVKHGVIRDPELFAWIERRLDAILRLDPAALTELVRWNVAVKARVVAADEREAGSRAHLNFGHTFAHAIEATDRARTYEHGEAVSLGMVAASTLAERLGRCERGLAARLAALLGRIGLPTAAARIAGDEELLAAMGRDKKVADGRLRLVLPDRLGAVTLTDEAPVNAVRDAWAAIR